MRVTWFLLDPASSSIFDELVKCIEDDQFTHRVSSGFLVDILRQDFAEGRFVERVTILESITDPFGQEDQIQRIGYNQIKFRLNRKAPHLEIWDAPRNTIAFINRLGEFTRGGVAIYSPEIAVQTWLAVLCGEATNAIVNRVILEVSVAGGAQCRMALAGAGDVRESIGSVLGERSYRISQASGRFQFRTVDAQITVKQASRIVTTAREEKVVPILRRCFRLALAKAKRGC